MLDINNVTIGYHTPKGLVKAVNKVSFSLEEGKILGLVGESGCGKSTILYGIMGLLSGSGRLVDGEILFNGRDLAKNTKRQWRRIRGNDIAIIFQDPMSALNPGYKVGGQILEMITSHEKDDTGPIGVLRSGRRKQKERVLELMAEVGIPDPIRRYDEYPHQFSGGMQQRALIAMALACEPKLLLADEPTTALDVTIQAQILDLLKRINKQHGTGIILVTHDLGVASEFCDDIAVMYAGQVVEKGKADAILQEPRHPYTRGLLSSIPKLTCKDEKIQPIEGNVADLLELGDTCHFYERCPTAQEKCRQPVGMLTEKDGHEVRCTLYE